MKKIILLSLLLTGCGAHTYQSHYFDSIYVNAFEKHNITISKPDVSHLTQQQRIDLSPKGPLR